MTFHGADESVSHSQSQSSSSPSSSPSSSDTNDTNSTITKKTPSTYQWAQSTELGDFVQEAAKDRKFVIAIQQSQPQTQRQAITTTKSSGDISTSATNKGEEDVAESSSNDKTQGPVLIKIRVPSFEERTLFLRRRLVDVTREMQSLLDIKSECDVSRHPSGQLSLQA